MIGQIYKHAAAFRPAFEYLDGYLEPVPAFTFTLNLPTKDVRVAEVIMAASGRCCGLPVYRFRIFFHPTDHVDAALARTIVLAVLKDLGADELQAVVGYAAGERHHLYVVLNRFHPVRQRVWAPWWDMRHMMGSLRRLEREHGLHQVVTRRGVGRAGERKPGGFRGPPDLADRPRKASGTRVTEAVS